MDRCSNSFNPGSVDLYFALHFYLIVIRSNACFQSSFDTGECCFMLYIINPSYCCVGMIEPFVVLTVVSDLPSFEHADKSLTLQKYPDLQKNIISSQTID